jgi:glucose-1-phosphate thymidylyltransferase
LRVIGIVPAAGWATRLNLTDGSKEMLAVMGRPLMDHVVERMRVLEPDSIRVVTRAAKLDVIKHSRDLGLDVMLAETRSTSHSIAIASENLKPDDLVMIGFPDSIWEPLNGYEIMLDHLTPERAVILGLFSSAEAEQGDVVVVDSSGLVRQIKVKPSPPPSNTIWACALARRWALDGIGSFEYPGQHFAGLSADGRVGAVWLSDRYFDIGTREALDAAIQGGWSFGTRLAWNHFGNSL